MIKSLLRLFAYWTAGVVVSVTLGVALQTAGVLGWLIGYIPATALGLYAVFTDENLS